MPSLCLRCTIKAEPASWWELCTTPGPIALGLMFCHCRLEILDNFWTRSPKFLFFTGPYKCHSWPCIRQTVPHMGPRDTGMFIHWQLPHSKSPAQDSNTHDAPWALTNMAPCTRAQPAKLQLAEELARWPQGPHRCLEDPELTWWSPEISL